MSGAELRRVLGRFALTQMELARRLKVAPTTVRRWIADTSPIPESVRLLLECWRRTGVPPK